jgi:hypothetical protein
MRRSAIAKHSRRWRRFPLALKDWYSILCKLIEIIVTAFQDSSIVVPTRRYIMEAQLSFVKGTTAKKRTLFLFNDILLMGKIKPGGKPGGPMR